MLPNSTNCREHKQLCNGPFKHHLPPKYEQQQQHRAENEPVFKLSFHLCMFKLGVNKHRFIKRGNNWTEFGVWLHEWPTFTGELLVATGSSLVALPGGEADSPAAYPCSEPAAAHCLPPPPPFPRWGRCLIPSRSRTRRMLAGRSSTPQSTKMRHSGHRSSLRELIMFSRQRRQKVCWHGSTLAVVSRRSRHTEHSSRSSSDEESSMSPERVSIWASVSVGTPRQRMLRVRQEWTGSTEHSGAAEPREHGRATTVSLRGPNTYHFVENVLRCSVSPTACFCVPLCPSVSLSLPEPPSLSPPLSLALSPAAVQKPVRSRSHHHHHTCKQYYCSAQCECECVRVRVRALFVCVFHFRTTLESWLILQDRWTLEVVQSLVLMRQNPGAVAVLACLAHWDNPIRPPTPSSP